MDDDETGSGSEDPDREAILARRRRFIAMALTGLTAAAVAGCDDTNSAVPAGDGAVGAEGAQPSSGPETAPHPCLMVTQNPQPAPDPGLQPRVDVGASEPVADPSPKPVPQPCLKVKARDPEPVPQPCLNVR